MKKLLEYSELLRIFSQDFPMVSVSYDNFNFGGKIHLFLLHFDAEETMHKNWQKIANAIAFYFQQKLNNDFEKWNTYLFYSTNQPVSNELKYIIENDTFSSRKILVENNTNLNKVFEEHISNKDLSFEELRVNIESFRKNDTISKAMGDRILRNKKTRIYSATEVLDTIAKSIRGK